MNLRQLFGCLKYRVLTHRWITILVGGLEHDFFRILGIKIPADFHIVQRGRYTTNQNRFSILCSRKKCAWRQVLHQVPRFSHPFRNSNWGPFDTQEAKCGVYERFGCHSRGDSARLMTHDSLHAYYFFCVSHSIVPHSLRVSPYHTRLWQELPVCTKKFETQSHGFCWVETLVMIPEAWGE